MHTTWWESGYKRNQVYMSTVIYPHACVLLSVSSSGMAFGVLACSSQ